MNSIKKATDWQTISINLRKNLNSVGYNPDLQKIYSNIEKMISHLSKLEVEYRRTNKFTDVEEQLNKINSSLNHLEKLILMAQLMR